MLGLNLDPNLNLRANAVFQAAVGAEMICTQAQIPRVLVGCRVSAHPIASTASTAHLGAVAIIDKRHCFECPTPNQEWDELVF